MARIDRRTSPNQVALWTRYELIDMQAGRSVKRVEPIRHGRREVRMYVRLATMMSRAVQAGRRLIGLVFGPGWVVRAAVSGP